MRPRRLAAALGLALLVPVTSRGADRIPFSNTILVYADPGRDWNAGSFGYYLAHFDKDGTPRDWLFDGFLFLAISAASKKNFWDGKAGLSISDGPTQNRRANAEPGKGNDIIWTIARPGEDGTVVLRSDPGTEIAALWAFPVGERFHLRAGSAGDTNAGLHDPGVSLVPDGKWRLGGEFGKNHRVGAAGAEVRVSVPPVAENWGLALRVDAAADVTAEVIQGGTVRAAAKIAAGSWRDVHRGPLFPGSALTVVDG